MLARSLGGPDLDREGAGTKHGRTLLETILGELPCSVDDLGAGLDLQGLAAGELVGLQLDVLRLRPNGLSTTTTKTTKRMLFVVFVVFKNTENKEKRAFRCFRCFQKHRQQRKTCFSLLSLISLFSLCSLLSLFSVFSV